MISANLPAAAGFEIQGRVRTTRLKTIQAAVKITVWKIYIEVRYKNQKQPCIFRARAGTKVRRSRNLAPCRVTDSRPRHSIVLKHKKTDHSRGSEVTRPKFEGQEHPPA